MKNKEIYFLYEALNELSEDKEIKFDIQLSYKLAYNKKILGPIYDAISEIKINLFNKYGIRTEEGWRIPPENVTEFESEWRELMDVDETVSLKVIKLQEIPNTKININLMGKLLPIIQE